MAITEFDDQLDDDIFSSSEVDEVEEDGDAIAEAADWTAGASARVSDAPDHQPSLPNVIVEAGVGAIAGALKKIASGDEVDRTVPLKVVGENALSSILKQPNQNSDLVDRIEKMIKDSARGGNEALRSLQHRLDHDGHGKDNESINGKNEPDATRRDHEKEHQLRKSGDALQPLQVGELEAMMRRAGQTAEEVMRKLQQPGDRVRTPADEDKARKMETDPTPPSDGGPHPSSGTDGTIRPGRLEDNIIDLNDLTKPIHIEQARPQSA